ncbi:MAG: response regulator transcription factor [Acidobacteriia bacterium]|nr:response regulator transcription factor [Methyloceanibacter sp.]MCL6491702.1 response regulator transcription factor [Terriglobia bacterium]
MAEKALLLLVDDDPALRRTLSEQLALDGEFAVIEAGSIAEARVHMAAQTMPFDALILDVGLPDGDGRDFCRDLRAEGLKIPIIILTASDGEVDIVRGLDAGANDYITKPFRLAELLARLRAQVRLYSTSDHATYRIGPYLFQPGARLLQDTEAGRRVRLTEKECAILKFLFQTSIRPVPRQMLLNEVWGYTDSISTHTLETHIYRLRQKIEPDPSRARFLITEDGGYWLNLNPEGPIFS